MLPLRASIVASRPRHHLGHPRGLASMRLARERARLRAHVWEVLAELHARDVSGLSAAQRSTRRGLLAAPRG